MTSDRARASLGVAVAAAGILAAMVVGAAGQEAAVPEAPAGGGAVVPSAPTTTTADAASAAQVDRARVAALVAGLGGEVWAAREEAQKALAAMGPDALPVLDEGLAGVKDPEVLRRLKEVYRRWVLQEQYAGDDLRPGFLGIQLDVVVGDDPRMGERENGVRVMGVVADTAAERGGLKEGDLIVSLNGKRFLGVFGIDHFKNRIQRIGAGGAVRMGIWREQAYLELDIVLGAPPEPTGRTVRIVDGGGPVREIVVPGGSGQGEADTRVLDHRWNMWWQNHVAEVARSAGKADRSGGESSGTSAPVDSAATTEAAAGGEHSKEKP
ncbi:MAG TPA: PDZ domain-containing protein [Phycisphaerae bacterium]|nr:PDZ domain-containing protein [Phycisphaerae bacterium]